MTEQEIEILDCLGDVFNAMVKLPQLHPSDIPEAQVHIHALQNMILAREAYRKYHAVA